MFQYANRPRSAAECRSTVRIDSFANPAGPVWRLLSSQQHEPDKTAISDVSAIHLGDLFIKTVEMPNGGVVMFLHVPFTVSRIVQAHSLDWLAHV